MPGDEAPSGAEHAPDDEPTTEELEEPSTEKNPGEEPKAPEAKDGEPSHHAVGIGILDDEEPHRD
ncbi:hypothetical protein FVP74_01560 [Microbacterium saccharophilum]|uniref:Uncharacterized protein n=2 Tax=Microbacterium saccharophilum TaxID=1213358 RepID=A0A5C8I8H1_9MICO|nr:hypothetical protein FVP74_01560 [Microbacterium saccharophilum]